jgi:dihydrofolate reductase
MPSNGRVRVYIACSLDGFIAGPGGDLSWLPGADPDASAPVASSQEPGAVEFDEFFADVGAILKGRATYEVVDGFGGPWAYGEVPVLVATGRSLNASRPTVTAVSGDIEELIETARTAAKDNDVYLDGGNVIRQALDAGLVDEMIITFVPVILGSGHALFAGATKRHELQFRGHHTLRPGMFQVRATPVKLTT